MVRKRIGEIFQEKFGVSADQIVAALALQVQKPNRLGEILVQQKTISEKDLLQALSLQMDIPYLSSLDGIEVDTSLLPRIPVHFAKTHKLFPIREQAGMIQVAVRDPMEVQPLDDLAKLLDLPVQPMVCSEEEIVSAIGRYYNHSGESAQKVMADLGEADLDLLTGNGDGETTTDLLEVAYEAPIIRLVNSMIAQAAKDRASDIHIEPYEKELKVRYRIDGILYDLVQPPKNYHMAIASRIKVMANLDIAEKRLPQDGRIKIRLGEREIDIRVSVIPTAFGERLVLRLLDKSNLLLDLEMLGLAPDDFQKYQRFVRHSHGIILETGPTGSGKTTTLYATLNRINSTDKNIITVEDPIEYQLNGVGQMQVNPKIDLTFANGLRSILRQDPDVILVGEIRDLETAEIAIQASLTGHLVFSTLHTNDSAGAVTRVLDMGIEPFLVSSSVVAIMAQRLVRTLCTSCKKEYTPAGSEIEELGIEQSRLYGHTIYLAVGCDKCMQTGYRGRTGIYELLLINDDVRSLILQNVNSQLIKNKAIEIGMTTLRADGAKKVLEGITSIEEVARVTQEDVIE